MIWTIPGFLIGFIAWFMLRYILTSFYTINQNERGVKTSFGRAERLGKLTTLDDPVLSATLRDKEKERYIYPQLRVMQPGGPYFKWPWEKVYKVSIATETVNMAHDFENPQANQGGKILEAVTKDQLNIGLQGQIRYRVSERNLYAYLFGVKRPIVHVMGYFVSILRERISSFEAPHHTEDDGMKMASAGISINDLRKNLNLVNEYMEQECASSSARYGIVLDASLITAIDPSHDVESALAAINTAHNQVSAEISIAQANADQKIVQSRRAVEIETLRAYAEVEPLVAVSDQLKQLKLKGPDVLSAYLRNVQLKLFNQADRVIMEEK